MRGRSILVTVATAGFIAGPAFVHGVIGGVAGARPECTITGTAADDSLLGTTRDDIICAKAGADYASAREGNDFIFLGQGDDYGAGEDGSDVVKGQADDDYVRGLDQNDELYGGQGADCVGENCGDPNSEAGNDFIKTRDGVSGNDLARGGNNTDTCRVDAGDTVSSCEL